MFLPGMVVPAVMLIILGYIDCTKTGLAILLLVLGVSLTGTQYSGWVVNHMDIAPAFAGILFGISNSIAAVTGFLSPVIVGVITTVCQLSNLTFHLILSCQPSVTVRSCFVYKVIKDL